MGSAPVEVCPLAAPPSPVDSLAESSRISRSNDRALSCALRSAMPRTRAVTCRSNKQTISDTQTSSTTSSSPPTPSLAESTRVGTHTHSFSAAAAGAMRGNAAANARSRRPSHPRGRMSRIDAITPRRSCWLPQRRLRGGLVSWLSDWVRAPNNEYNLHRHRHTQEHRHTQTHRERDTDTQRKTHQSTN